MEILGFNIPVWLILLLVFAILFYRYFSNFTIFKENGIPGPKPVFLFGTSLPFFKKGLFEFDLGVHREFKKVAGCFIGPRPELLVFDLEILKKIFVKDFSTFRNRYAIETKQYPMDKMLTVLRDEHWKYVRSHVSPNFSGRKLRQIAQHVNKCAQILTDNIEEVAISGDVFEAKDYAGYFTMDAIARTAFSLDINSKKDQNSLFVRNAQKVFDLEKFSFTMLILVFLPGLTPYLSKIGLSVMDQEAADFFVNIVEKSMSDREQNPNESPKDFLTLLLNAKLDKEQEEELAKEKNKSEIWNRQGLTKEEILAQAMIFFLAGYDTSATTLSFTMYNLAVHPECQERVYAEICDVLGPDQEPDYDTVKQMKYLEMCVDETLRLYPPAPRTNRVASEPIEIDGVRIPAGMSVGVSAYALHRDPDAWPEPDKFIPERFTEEAKSARHPCQYIPFGLGPRNCVAQRLALMEVKMALVHIVRKFNLVSCEKTQIPIQLDTIKMKAQKGIWLKAELRD